MKYGFDESPALDTIKLPTPSRAPETRHVAPPAPQVLQAGAELGFLSREVNTRRKPGPKRKEPQDKITVTGPKRVIDRLKAYCDQIGGVSYSDAIETLLNGAEDRRK